MYQVNCDSTLRDPGTKGGMESASGILWQILTEALYAIHLPNVL
jgi:hypothetical protein